MIVALSVAAGCQTVVDNVVTPVTGPIYYDLHYY